MEVPQSSWEHPIACARRTLPQTLTPTSWVLILPSTPFGYHKTELGRSSVQGLAGHNYVHLVAAASLELTLSPAELEHRMYLVVTALEPRT